MGLFSKNKKSAKIENNEIGNKELKDNLSDIVAPKSSEDEIIKIKIESNSDKLYIDNENIIAEVLGEKYTFKITDIDLVMIITNDLGPFYDDMCLAICINQNTVIFIMSEHPLYQTFLFDQLGKSIELNYDNVIKASTCTDNNTFLLYKK